jgi:hypothetical protein
MSFNPYNSFLDIPKVRNSIVAFLDILGFQEMMNNDHEGIILPKIYKTLRFAESIVTPGNIDQIEAWSIKLFKDSIVYGQPIESDGELELTNAFFRLAVYQLQMVMVGFFIRGGLGIGPHYMDDEIVYGPTLIEIYTLECQQAVEPRIILSKSAWELVQNYLASNKKPAQSLQNFFVLQDTDNTYFLNYLAASVVNYGDNNIAPKLISIHKKQVTEKLKQFKNNPKVWSKYFWVANYHNNFCGLYPTLNTYKIDEKFLRLEPHEII